MLLWFCVLHKTLGEEERWGLVSSREVALIFIINVGTLIIL